MRSLLSSCDTVLYNLFWELDSGQDSASLESADEGDLYHVAWEICFLTEALSPSPPKKNRFLPLIFSFTLL